MNRTALSASVMRLRAGAMMVMLVAPLAGCAGSGDTGGPTGSRADNANIKPAITGTAGAGAMPTAPTTPSDFGNSATPTAKPAMMQQQKDGVLPDGCKVGERCASKGPDGDCGSLTLEADVKTVMHPGNVLLVFDTSGSMAEKWGTSTRWESAGGAIKNALMPLADQLTIGTVFFPRSDPNAPAVCVDPTGIACIFVPQLVVPGGTCGVTPITSMDQINFQPGPQFLTTFGMGAAPPYAPVPGGFTPLKEGLQQADMALSSSMLTGITSVVVVTDGDPNCEWDANAAHQIVANWQAKGINTYVIGLPGTTGAGDTVLTDLATTGGTGAYIQPDNPKALEDKLREIATETLRSGFDSCEINITPPAEAPEKLHLIVTENSMPQDVKKDLADDYKWNVTDDGSKVTLEGRLCDDATGGRFEAIRFEFGCVDVPPLPPPPPVL